MGDENGRREADTKLALIEQHLEFIAQEMAEMKADVRRYNGFRERVDNLCKEIKEHKSNHWQTIGLSVAITGIVVSIIFKVM